MADGVNGIEWQNRFGIIDDEEACSVEVKKNKDGDWVVSIMESDYSHKIEVDCKDFGDLSVLSDLDKLQEIKLNQDKVKVTKIDTGMFEENFAGLNLDPNYSYLGGKNYGVETNKLVDAALGLLMSNVPAGVQVTTVQEAYDAAMKAWKDDPEIQAQYKAAFEKMANILRNKLCIAQEKDQTNVDIIKGLTLEDLEDLKIDEKSLAEIAADEAAESAADGVPAAEPAETKAEAKAPETTAPAAEPAETKAEAQAPETTAPAAEPAETKAEVKPQMTPEQAKAAVEKDLAQWITIQEEVNAAYKDFVSKHPDLKDKIGSIGDFIKNYKTLSDAANDETKADLAALKAKADEMNDLVETIKENKNDSAYKAAYDLKLHNDSTLSGKIGNLLKTPITGDVTVEKILQVLEEYDPAKQMYDASKDKGRRTQIFTNTSDNEFSATASWVYSTTTQFAGEGADIVHGVTDRGEKILGKVADSIKVSDNISDKNKAAKVLNIFSDLFTIGKGVVGVTDAGAQATTGILSDQKHHNEAIKENFDRTSENLANQAVQDDEDTAHDAKTIIKGEDRLILVFGKEEFDQMSEEKKVELLKALPAEMTEEQAKYINSNLKNIPHTGEMSRETLIMLAKKAAADWAAAEHARLSMNHFEEAEAQFKESQADIRNGVSNVLSIGNNIFAGAGQFGDKEFTDEKSSFGAKCLDGMFGTKGALGVVAHGLGTVGNAGNILTTSIDTRDGSTTQAAEDTGHSAKEFSKSVLNLATFGLTSALNVWGDYDTAEEKAAKQMAKLAETKAEAFDDLKDELEDLQEDITKMEEDKASAAKGGWFSKPETAEEQAKRQEAIDAKKAELVAKQEQVKEAEREAKATALMSERLKAGLEAKEVLAEVNEKIAEEIKEFNENDDYNVGDAHNYDSLVARYEQLKAQATDDDDQEDFQEKIDELKALKAKVEAEYKKVRDIEGQISAFTSDPTQKATWARLFPAKREAAAASAPATKAPEQPQKTAEQLRAEFVAAKKAEYMALYEEKLQAEMKEEAIKKAAVFAWVTSEEAKFKAENPNATEEQISQALADYTCDLEIKIKDGTADKAIMAKYNEELSILQAAKAQADELFAAGRANVLDARRQALLAEFEDTYLEILTSTQSNAGENNTAGALDLEDVLKSVGKGALRAIPQELIMNSNMTANTAVWIPLCYIVAGAKMGYEGTQELKEAMMLYLNDPYNTALKEEAIERGVKAIMKILGGTAIGTIPTHHECCVLFEKICKHSGGSKRIATKPAKPTPSTPVVPPTNCQTAAGTATTVPSVILKK